MKALLLTAGLGTRLRPLTDRFAKPALPFLNVPVMYYPVPLLEQLNVKSIVFNTHHHAEQIIALAETIPGWKGRVDFSPEIEKPLGPGGGIGHARKFLEGDDSFLVANGDEIILPRSPNELNPWLQAHQASDAIATISVMRHPGVGQQFGGVWADRNGRVLGFGKNRAEFPEAHEGFHYIGLLLLRDRVFSYIPQGESNIFYDVLKRAIASGEKVQCVVGDFTWYETGNAQDFIHSSREAMGLLFPSTSGRTDGKFLREIIRRFVFPAVNAEMGPAGGSKLISPLARVHLGARLSGFVVAAAGAVIEQGAEVCDCILLPGARVPAGTKIRESILAPPV